MQLQPPEAEREIILPHARQTHELQTGEAATPANDISGDELLAAASV